MAAMVSRIATIAYGDPPALDMHIRELQVPPPTSAYGTGQSAIGNPTLLGTGKDHGCPT
jgi:hypothetical protein